MTAFRNMTVGQGETLDQYTVRRTEPFNDETVTLIVRGRVNYSAPLETETNEVLVYASDEATALWAVGQHRYFVQTEDAAGNKHRLLEGELTVRP